MKLTDTEKGWPLISGQRRRGHSVRTARLMEAGPRWRLGDVLGQRGP